MRQCPKKNGTYKQKQLHAQISLPEKLIFHWTPIPTLNHFFLIFHIFFGKYTIKDLLFGVKQFF